MRHQGACHVADVDDGRDVAESVVGRSLRKLGLMVSALMTMPKVWPSGGAVAMAWVPITVPPPGGSRPPPAAPQFTEAQRDRPHDRVGRAAGQQRRDQLHRTCRPERACCAHKRGICVATPRAARKETAASRHDGNRAEEAHGNPPVRLRSQGRADAQIGRVSSMSAGRRCGAR